MLRSWVIVAVSVAAAWPARAAYLPLLGPGALRYERPVRAAKAAPLPLPEQAAGVEASPAPGETATSQPPSPSSSSPSPPSAAVETGPAQTPATNPPLAVVEPWLPPAPTNQASSATAPAPQAPAEPEITPQMLVQYFKIPAPDGAGGTNSAGVMVTMPLFQPPQPGRIPPSSARYETPEPRRSVP